jgi:DNA polymerase III delta subunit
MATQADLEALLQAAKAGSLKPIVLIYGDQEYLAKQAYDRLLDALVPEDLRSFNLEQLDGTRADLGQVLDSFNTLPLMPGPKAVGLIDARFFQSKANAGELLQKAKDRWLAGEPGPALRQLARVLSLAEWGWSEGLAASDEQWAEALDLSAADFGRIAAGWLKVALLQAQASEFPLPPSADESGQFADGIEAALAAGGEGLYLVCAATSADARKRLYKLFHERGHVLDFKKETRGGEADMTARAFLALALKQRNLTAKGGLGPRLAAAYGGDLGVLQRELDKLEAYAFPRQELEEADLRAVGTPIAEDDVFELLKALGSRDLGQALKVLQRQLGLDPSAAFQLFGMLCSELRKLAVMRALMDEGRLAAKGPSNFQAFKANVYPAVAKALPTGLAGLWKKTNPYPLHQSMERARAFSAPQLRGLSLQLAQMDLDMKSGGISAADALEEIVLRFCGVQEEAIL